MSAHTDHRNGYIRALKHAAKSDSLNDKTPVNDIGFITAAGVGRCIGESNSSRVKKNYLDGLNAINGKLYLITEVADRLLAKDSMP